MISPIPHSPITIISAIIRKDYVNEDSMLRIGEIWRKTDEHKEDRMHNSPCIPGDDRYGLCRYMESW